MTLLRPLEPDHRRADTKKQRAQLVRQGGGLVDTAHQITKHAITGDAKYEEAGAFLVAIKGYVAQVEAHHAPMLEKAQRTIDVAREARGAVADGEAKLLQPAAEAEGIVKVAMQKFLAIRRARQALIEAARKEKAMQAAVAATKATKPTVIVVPDKPLKPRPVVAGVAVRRVWKFEVENEFKIDHAYLKPDLVLIRKAVVAFDSAEVSEAAVGGIRVWQEDEIAAGGGQ